MRYALMLTMTFALATGLATTADAQKWDKNGRCHAASGQFAKDAVCAGAPRSGTVRPAGVGATREAPAAAGPAAPAPPAMAAKQRCKNDKGQFAKCGSPGAHPAA
jgi:hypothetical protein